MQSSLHPTPIPRKQTSLYFSMISASPSTSILWILLRLFVLCLLLGTSFPSTLFDLDGLWLLFCFNSSLSLAMNFFWYFLPGGWGPKCDVGEPTAWDLVDATETDRCRTRPRKFVELLDCGGGEFSDERRRLRPRMGSSSGLLSRGDFCACVVSGVVVVWVSWRDAIVFVVRWICESLGWSSMREKGWMRHMSNTTALE